SAVTLGTKVLRGGNEILVQQAQAASIQVDDGIEVVQLKKEGEQSYSILDFADHLEVELFSNTSVFLKELRQDAEGSTHATLHLDRGNMFVHLNEQTDSRITVQTLYTTIKTLTSGTEFDVCHNKEFTCVLVKKGVVEVTAKGRKNIVKAGEAGYIFKDEPPSAAICAPTPVFIAWEGRYRRFADTAALEEELSLLPQEPCRVTASGLPINAHILYRDEFRSPSSGWDRGKIDNFYAQYARFDGRRYYQVQVQGLADQYLASVPNKRPYEDANIDIRAVEAAASSGDFRYGLVLRQSGNQYYAFVISPRTKTWHFLKSSSSGLETLKEGIEERMRDLESRKALRVEAYGSTFLLFINGRFIDWISDPDYARGEVGLFVESMDSPDAIIRFDSIIIWDIPPAVQDTTEGSRENCFNTSDDDGDRLIDRADPNCQRLDHDTTSLPLTTNTPKPTRTPRPTRTRTPPTNPPSSPTNPPINTPVPPIPTIQPPLPTTLPPLPTALPPLPTILPPLPTILPPISTILPLPTIQLPLRTEPSVESPTPK
ncbi:MAG TPA: FecR domain-containing protein, partial [Anaerolineales bacterium]|nr:FecR domain-containing protein [Anaerolineales bacterium]